MPRVSGTKYDLPSFFCILLKVLFLVVVISLPVQAEEQIITRTYTYDSAQYALNNGMWNLQYGGAYYPTLYTSTLTADSLQIANTYGGEDYFNWGAWVWNCSLPGETITRVTFHYRMCSYLTSFHIALFAQDQPILSSGSDGTCPIVKWQISRGEPTAITEGTATATWTCDEDIISIGLGFYDVQSDPNHFVYFDQITIETTQSVTYQTYNYAASGLTVNNGDWLLKYGGTYWATLYTSSVNNTSLQFSNTYGGEDYPNWGARVWNVPSDQETIVGVSCHYRVSGYLESFSGGLFATTAPILSSGASGIPPTVIWKVSGGSPNGMVEGNHITTFDLDDNVKCIGLGFLDTLSDSGHQVVFDTIVVTTVKPIQSASYCYEIGGLPLNNGEWTLNYGGSYWTTLYTPTLNANSFQIANTYGGEDYPNWGAYVWCPPSYKEIITGVNYSYRREGCLSTFNGALFAQDHRIVGTGLDSTSPPIKWSVPGPGHVQGVHNELFSTKDKIASIGLGFWDTQSSSYHYASFNTIRINTVKTNFSSPYPSRDPLLPDRFVSVNDGHLSYNGNRLRLWGMNFLCGFQRNLVDIELMFDRVVDAGFNAIRLNLFETTFLQNQTQDSWHVQATTVGDNSLLGRLDYAVYLARLRGLFIWSSFDRLYYPMLPGDYDILPDDGHRTEWVAMACGSGFNQNLAYLDDRVQALHIAYAKAILNHINPYTGKRYADEESFALYEIFNENVFLDVFTPQNTDQGAVWNNLPAYVKEKIRVKWNTWLASKYGTSYNLYLAWAPNMYSGENLTTGNLRFDNGPDHTGQRPRDIMEFNAWLYNDYNQRFINEVRTLASAGRGINIVPITPTGSMGSSSLLQYYGAQMGDFVCTSEYGLACQKNRVSVTDPGYPFLSNLTWEASFRSPIDLMRVKGKPYLLYEANDFRPNPYGVEFPIRVATQMAWLDADGVFCGSAWEDTDHFPALRRDDDYTHSALPMPEASYPQAGLFLANDEVMLAAMKSAGTIFLNGNLPSGNAPFEWTCGKDRLFDPTYSALPSWGDLQWRLRYYAWGDGIQITYDPSVNSSAVQGHSLGSYVQQGPYVRYDWANIDPGTLKIDAPNIKVLGGFIGPNETIGDMTVTNLNQNFSFIMATSQDGESLVDSESILITMLSDSNNTGYAFNSSNLIGTDDLMELVRGLSNPGGSSGRAPVVVHRVSGTFTAPWMAGMTYEKISFDRRCYSRGQIDQDNPTFTITADEPLFYARLTRSDTTASDYVSISGQITLNGFSGNLADIPITIDLRDNQGYLVESRTLYLDANGNYTFFTKSKGVFNAFAKASHWLRQKYTSVDTTSSDAVADFNLTNGDCDSDNEVTSSDLSIVLTAKGGEVGSSNWDSRADLDGNGLISDVDLSIVSLSIDLMDD